MPTYEITAPDGKTYDVTAPEGATQEQVLAYAKSHYGQQQTAPAQPAPAQQSQPNGLADAVRSIPGGLAKGGAALAGLPGDIEGLFNSGADKLLGLINPEAVKQVQARRQEMEANSPGPKLPTSAGINKAISDPFGGYYQPKTKAGQYAETIASFAPNALAPGSALARIARVAVPGAASETAGHLTKGSKYEGLARAGGALAGGVMTGLGESLLAKRANTVPTMEELGKLKADAYTRAKAAGVEISPQSFQQFATDLGTDITKNNVVSGKLHPQTLAAIEAIQQEAAIGAPLSLERADLLRQEVTGAFENASAKDARLLTKVKQGLDDYLDSLTPGDTLAGDASVAVPILKEARGLAQREFKAAKMDELIALAENSAKANTSPTGVDQNLRTQFKAFNAQLIKNPSVANSFTKAERDAIAKVAHGSPARYFLRLIGKLAPTTTMGQGVGASLGAAGGALIGGPVGAGVGAVAVPAVGAAARGAANYAAMSDAQRAAQLMRAGTVMPGAPTAGTNWALPLLLAHRPSP